MIVKLFILIILIVMAVKVLCSSPYSSSYNNYEYLPKCRTEYPTKEYCPAVPTAKNFDLEQHLGHWFIIETSLDLPDCAFAVRTKTKPYYPKPYAPSYGYPSHSPNSDYGQASYSYPSYEPPQEVQSLTVNYFDRYTNTAKTKYSGKTSPLVYGGSSFRNSFTSGSVSDVRILYADYDPSCGYMLMITCTTQSNGDFEVNSNILARTPYLDKYYLNSLHKLLLKYDLKDVESRLKPNNHRNCQPLPSYTKKTEY